VAVPQVVDRVEPVAEERVPEDPEAPIGPPDRHRERDAECNRERSGVARVVVVANAERADLAEEGPGVDQLVGAEREVADRERHEEDANDIATANCSLPL